MKKTKKFLTGFTLIELLVVIAIIGILASIVLVSFPSATKKANDSRVEAAMSQMRVLITSYQSTNGSYTGIDCATDIPAGMKSLCDEVANKDLGKVAMTLHVSADAVCMYAPLNVGNYYCVDSVGKAGVIADPAAVGGCDGTTFVCPAGTTL